MKTTKIFLLFLLGMGAISCTQDRAEPNALFSIPSGDEDDVTTIPIITNYTRPIAGTYESGDTIDSVIEFDQDVTVEGTPKMILKIGRYEKAANCTQLTASSIKCSYTLGDNYSEPDLDLDGISFERYDLASGSVSASAGGKVPDLSSASADLSDIKVHYLNFTNWLDANDSSTLFSDSGCNTAINDGENIGCWIDKKSGISATSLGAAMPLYASAGGSNSMSTVNFSRDHVAFSSPVIIATNYTVITMFNITSYNALNYMFSSANNVTDGVGMGFGGTWGGGNAGDGLFALSKIAGTTKTMASTHEPALNQWEVASYTTQKIYTNDAEVAGYSQTDLIATPFGFTKFGRRDDMNACCDHMGNISEFMVFDKELNDDQLQEVWCYLSDKYDLNYTDC